MNRLGTHAVRHHTEAMCKGGQPHKGHASSMDHLDGRLEAPSWYTPFESRIDETITLLPNP